MKKFPRLKTVFIGIFAVLVSFLIAENLIIKVRSTYLRKEPKFYASTVASLKIGESVVKLASRGDWIRVKIAGGLEGWLHIGAVQSKKVGLVAMDNTMQTKASADEVALASKGFNEQVEKEFKSKNKNVDFAWVDRMLKISVSPSELREFLQKGKLAEFGGGR